MNLTLDTTEISRLLNLIPSEFRKRVKRKALRKGAQIIARRARQLAPYNRNRREGTHLRRAIIVEEFGRTGDFSIGTKYTGTKAAPHAHLLEYGTVKMSARPFLFPAYRQTKDQVIDTIAEELARGLT